VANSLRETQRLASCVSQAVLNHGVRELKGRLEWEMKRISVDINSDWSPVETQVLELVKQLKDKGVFFCEPVDFVDVRNQHIVIYAAVRCPRYEGHYLRFRGLPTNFCSLADLEIGESACHGPQELSSTCYVIRGRIAFHPPYYLLATLK
jgi:hypothetical protein